MYLWLKFFHLFFIISWFAGLFYLPRIYVNLAQYPFHSNEYRRLLEMSERLFRFMTPLGIAALIFGTLILWSNNWFSMGWSHGKLFIGLLLAIYHFYCYRILQTFRQNKNKRSHKWFRVFNEIPVLFMIFAIYLAVFKPF